MINLDHNATTPAHPDVVRAVADAMTAQFANSASQHGEGRRARQVVETAREHVLSWLGGQTDSIEADQLIFTGGGTEANHLALVGLAGDPPGRIVVSRIEHPSVTRTAQLLQTRGFDVQWIDVGEDGQVDLDAAQDLITETTRLVSVMWANHETGVIQPLAPLSQLCRRFGVPLHTDATQAVGKLPVNFREMQVSALSFAGHKFHGPRGIGGLILRHGVALEPTMVGGFQQGGLRPGTESVELAAGLQAAADAWIRHSPAWRHKMQQVREMMESQLGSALPDSTIHGRTSPRLPQTISIGFPGLNRQALVMALDLQQVACSTGSACASGSSEPSPVLRAMGICESLVEGSIRLSWGAMSSVEECAEAARRIISSVNDLRTKKTRPKLSRPSPQ